MAKKDYFEWSKEELIRELKKMTKQKKYGIIWEDKQEQVALLCKEKLPVLVEDRSKEIKTGETKPMNILIEGDNYHALSVLNYTHKGKIDVIYIDPPYNTGNGEGFIYNDKIVDREDAFRHSKWISFIEKRLRLAKNLLKNKGIVFISIDDNEVAQLKLLCNEIFGEENFICSYVRVSKKGSSMGKFYSPSFDYVLCYAKNIKIVPSFAFPQTETYVAQFSKSDSYGNYKTAGLYQSSLDPMRGCANQRYFIECPDGSLVIPPGEVYPGHTRDGVKIGPKSRKDKVWRWSVDRYLKEKVNLIFIQSKYSPLVDQHGRQSKWNVLTKQYLKNEDESKVVPGNIIEGSLNSEAGKELKELNVSFDFPKPTSLIKYLCRISRFKKDGIILDFFAGSGTTAHAILDLNREDDGNRKFILCTNNENNICTEVCYPRVKKVIQNLVKESNGKLVKNLPGNLRYFKTDFVDAEPTDRNKHKMVDKTTEMLCLKEECFDEVMKDHSFRIFTNGQGKNLGIIYDDDGIVPFKKEAKNQKKKFVVYVFSLDESAREEEFEDVADLVELKPIPAVILNVYNRIFK